MCIRDRECGVADGKHLVNQEDVRFKVGCDGEGQTHVHPARVALYGCVEELLGLCESNDLVEPRPYLPPPHAKDRAVEVDVLSTGEFWVESCSHLKETPHSA